MIVTICLGLAAGSLAYAAFDELTNTTVSVGETPAYRIRSALGMSLLVAPALVLCLIAGGAYWLRVIADPSARVQHWRYPDGQLAPQEVVVLGVVGGALALLGLSALSLAAIAGNLL